MDTKIIVSVRSDKVFDLIENLSLTTNKLLLCNQSEFVKIQNNIHGILTRNCIEKNPFQSSDEWIDVSESQLQEVDKYLNDIISEYEKKMIRKWELYIQVMPDDLPNGVKKKNHSISDENLRELSEKIQTVKKEISEDLWEDFRRELSLRKLLS